MRAFTLLELLVSMAILAALTAFAVPSFQLILAQYQLSSAANELADFIRLTEQKTVTEQKTYGVTLQSNAQAVTQYLLNTDTGVKTTQDTYSLPSSIKINQVNFGGQTDIYFTTSGAPQVSGDVVLKDTVRDRSKRVEIKPSGAITTNEGEF